MDIITIDSDDDIVAIDSDDDEPAPDIDNPIILLFKQLTNRDNEQKIVVTNALIFYILDKEFSINIRDIHKLEAQIYLEIMKKCLKDWPQWEELDKAINLLKNDQEALNKMLVSNYHNLKDYLKVTLDRAQTLAKNTVNKMIEDKKIDPIPNQQENKDDDVVLEIQCSRRQLNQLIFRRPNLLLNDSIFNRVDFEPTQIKVNRLPLEAILNWWEVKICILKDTTYFYERKTNHELSHVLVNKNLMSQCNPLKVLPQEIQIRQEIKTEQCTTSIFNYIASVDKLKREYPTLVPLLKFVQKDIKLLPDKIASRTSYRRYTNKYPYIRYLYKDVKNPDISSQKYNLQLEETVSPMYTVYLGPTLLENCSIEVECSACAVKFTGASIVADLKTHFEEHHADEPDWKCTNCAKIFPMASLAQNWWTHKC